MSERGTPRMSGRASADKDLRSPGCTTLQITSVSCPGRRGCSGVRLLPKSRWEGYPR